MVAIVDLSPLADADEGDVDANIIVVIVAVAVHTLALTAGGGGRVAKSWGKELAREDGAYHDVADDLAGLVAAEGDLLCGDPKDELRNRVAA